MQSSRPFKTFYKPKRTQKSICQQCSAHRAHRTYIYTENKLDKKAPFKWKSIYQVLTISEHISLSPLN